MKITLTCPNCGSIRHRSLPTELGTKIICLVCNASAIYIGKSFVIKEDWAWEVKPPPPDMEIRYKCACCNRHVMGRIATPREIKEKGLTEQGIYPVYHASFGKLCPGYDQEIVPIASKKRAYKARAKRKVQP